MKSFLTFLNEESESNKRELERINQDRKDEGKPPFRTLDQALTYYEKEDEKARRKKLRENREVSKAGDYDDSDLPSKGPKNFEIIDKIDGSMHSQSGETSTYLVRGDDGYHYTIAPRYGEAKWAIDNEDIGDAPKTWDLGPKHRKTFDIVDRIDNVKNSDHRELMKRYKIEIPETPDYDSDPMSAEDAQNMRRNQPNHLPRSARDGGGVSAYYQ